MGIESAINAGCRGFRVKVIPTHQAELKDVLEGGFKEVNQK